MGYGQINSRDLDNYITGHYGEDQFKDDEPEDEEVSPDQGDDIAAALAAENEGMALPEEEE